MSREKEGKMWLDRKSREQPDLCAGGNIDFFILEREVEEWKQ